MNNIPNTLAEKKPAGYVRWFEEIGTDDVPLVGGKNASLGEMYRALDAKGVKVPNGFAITAEAYLHFLNEAKLDVQLEPIELKLKDEY